MDEKEFLKDGILFGTFKFLAKHYGDFRYLNCDIWFSNGGAEEMRECSACSAIADDIEAAILGMRESRLHNRVLYDVVFSHYLDSMSGETNGERAIRLCGSRSQYYKCLNYGTEIAAINFWRRTTDNEASPFYGQSQAACIEIFGFIKNSLMLHETNNYCYLETLNLLENYIKFKCLSEGIRPMGTSFVINEDFHEKLKQDAVDWKYGNLMKGHQPYGVDFYEEGRLLDSLKGYINSLDQALDVLRDCSEKGKKAYDILYLSYLDVQFYQLKFGERIEISGYKGKTFYNRRQDAIRMLSEILWGPLGHRTRKSYFTVRAAEEMAE